jgi:hypothetical protein
MLTAYIPLVKLNFPVSILLFDVNNLWENVVLGTPRNVVLFELLHAQSVLVFHALGGFVSWQKIWS